MDALINLLSKFDSAVIATICLIVLFIIFWVIGKLIKSRESITDIFNKWFNQKTKKNEILQMIYDSKNRLDKFEENQIHDREQSFEIQKQLTDTIRALSEKMDAMEEKHDKRVRAELKDKIGRYYNYYHEKQSWSDMEKEVMDDLIAEYEAAGGKNSFVHDTVQPESYQWKIIERI